MLQKIPKTVIYFCIVVAAFFLLFIPSKVFNPLKFSVVQTTSLPIRVVMFPFKELKKILFYHRTYEAYMVLKKEVNTLKARVVGFHEVLVENNRLERLLEFKRELIYSSVAASIVGRNPSSWNEVIIINKGEQDGIKPGMAVVNASGVVGKISEVTAHSAKVILLTDPNFSVAVLVKRSREVGLVSGTLQGLCRMRYLSSDADVSEGDQVITSKLSSSFPGGLLVGEVVKVQFSESSPTIDCIIHPAVSLTQIEEVLVVQNNGNL